MVRWNRNLGPQLYGKPSTYNYGDSTLQLKLMPRVIAPSCQVFSHFSCQGIEPNVFWGVFGYFNETISCF